MLPRSHRWPAPLSRAAYCFGSPTGHRRQGTPQQPGVLAQCTEKHVSSRGGPATILGVGTQRAREVVVAGIAILGIYLACHGDPCNSSLERTIHIMAATNNILGTDLANLRDQKAHLGAVLVLRALFLACHRDQQRFSGPGLSSPNSPGGRTTFLPRGPAQILQRTWPAMVAGSHLSDPHCHTCWLGTTSHLAWRAGAMSSQPALPIRVQCFVVIQLPATMLPRL